VRQIDLLHRRRRQPHVVEEDQARHAVDLVDHDTLIVCVSVFVPEMR
jgi:hypothetical protein